MMQHEMQELAVSFEGFWVWGVYEEDVFVILRACSIKTTIKNQKKISVIAEHCKPCLYP